MIRNWALDLVENGPVVGDEVASSQAVKREKLTWPGLTEAVRALGHAEGCLL